MISFREFLYELFDKPYKETFDIENTSKNRKHITDNNIPIDAKTLRVHKLEGDNGYVMSYHRDGALEIHHPDDEGKTGLDPHSTKTNSRYISTMVNHAKTRGLNRGHKVRIIAYDAIMPHYKRIVNKIAKKEGYKVEHKNEMIDGKLRPTILIHPHSKPFFENVMLTTN